MDNRFNEKSLNDQKVNEKITSYEKKAVLKCGYLILFQVRITFFLYYMQKVVLETKKIILVLKGSTKKLNQFVKKN